MKGEKVEILRNIVSGEGDTGQIVEQIKNLIETSDDTNEKMDALFLLLNVYSKLNTWTETDLNFIELVHQVIGEFEEKFEERNLTMVVHFDEEEAIICADGRRLWRVLENVFGNVSKYAMENTRVYVDVKVDRPNVQLSLKNISAQPLNISAEELTERFIRGDVSRNTEGSGLGLSIAKDLVQLQGGELKLYLDGDLFKVTIEFRIK